MTLSQIQLVRDSSVRVRAIADTAAGVLFPSRPFEIAPDVGQVLARDVGQARKVRRRFGLPLERVATAGEAVVWSLGRGLGEAWISENEEGWTAVYGSLAGLTVTVATEIQQPEAKAA